MNIEQRFKQGMANLAAQLRKAAADDANPHDSDYPPDNEPLDFSDGRAVAQAAAEDEAARAKLAARLQARSNGDPTIKGTNMDLSEHTPPAGSLGDNGRLQCARAIRAAHKCASGDLVKQHFAAAPRDIDLSTLRLSNGRLRKSTSTLVADLARAGITLKPASGNDSVAVFKQMKATLSPALPPQSPGQNWDNNRARDGATLATDANASDPGRRVNAPKAPPFPGTSPHSASVRVGRPPPEDLDAATKAIAAIHAAGPSRLWGH